MVLCKGAFFLALGMLLGCESPLLRSSPRTNAENGASTREATGARLGGTSPSSEDAFDNASSRSTTGTKEALRFRTRDLSVTLEWIETPRVNAESRATLRFFKTDGTPDESVHAETVSVMLYMKAHGHGAPAVEVFEDKAGELTVESMIFTMPGTWQIHVALANSGEPPDEIVWDVVL